MIDDYEFDSIDEGESYDGELAEYDDAFADMDDGDEDFGEARWRRRRTVRRPSRYVRVQGRGGLAVRSPSGQMRRLPFPEPLATARETNRGLARQELSRRDLANRLNRLEVKQGTDQSKASATTGIVTFSVGGSMALWGLFQASKNQGGATFSNWSAERGADTAALISAAQLATSGAKTVINGRYPRSGPGIAADVFAAGVLAAYAFGKLRPGLAQQEWREVKDYAAARTDAQRAGAKAGEYFVTDNGTEYVAVPKAGGGLTVKPVRK